MSYSNSMGDHSFFGYWEITESLDPQTEDLGLCGIKFFLDESGDIIFLNDLFSLQVVAIDQTSPTIWSASKSMMIEDDKSKLSTGNESADILFCCETFEVIVLEQQHGTSAALLFRSFTGHHIEFRTNTIKPLESMTLKCEGWCTLTCKRIKKDQSIGQSIQYTLLPAFEEKFFSDIVIKSCDGYSFEVHSSILRLNGFDCNSLNQSTPVSSTPISSSMQQPPSNFLSPPTIHLSTFNFSPNFVNHISNSFNCLATTRDSNYMLAAPLNTNLKNGQISSSDSHLNSLQENVKENIFNFPTAQVNQQQTMNKKSEHKNKLRLSSSQIIFKNPTSPFRVRNSPLPFLNLSIDTPLTPSSPLTSVSVLFNLTKDTLAPVLHWLYSESLPQHLNETQLEALLKLCATIPPLNKMSSSCKKYLRLIKLKKVIIDIFVDIHGCLNRINNMLNPFNLSKYPSSMCEVFKQCLRETAIGFALFLQLSQIFSKDTFLSRFQRNEIIKFVKSRIPITITQLHQILQNILIIIRSLNPEEKEELVIHLVPEVILALDVTTELFTDFKNSLEAICKSIQGDQEETCSKKRNDQSHSNASAVLFLHVCEIKQLHDVYGKVNSILEIIQQQQLAFKSMNIAEKQSCININMDHLLIEIPNVIERLEDLSKNMNDKFGWKEFKFCFKFATSHINGILSKLLEHKQTLLYPMLKLTQLVNRNAFTAVVEKIELLQSDVAAKNFDPSDTVDSEQKTNNDYNSYKINIFSSLCEPPNANNSNLAKNALKLLHSGNLADMEFEVITTAVVDCQISASTPVSIITTPPTNNNDEFDFNDGTLKKEYHIFKAHRVIVASRCEYLRKALLSGMQEDINRKITIYDASPVIFRRFLLYLYGAPVDKNVGLESICELMLLADRYSVDSLKEVCEQTLISMIDSDSVICMLGIADRFNANTLKTSCLSFISQHIELTSSESFTLLSQELQSEVFDLIHWRKRCTTDSWNLSSSRYDDQYRSRHTLKSPSRPSKSRSRKSSPNSYHK
ncbi:hypothetical protein PVAND_014032 [Polypedilum vanderplanki]|uniref:BTB domain-containing protein n=1 Tax=Polypedilum vanderplanki TaxID=319348 RepID=A0A9J6CT89_POLVA|nr:hypothetical protein PVAND_014032 [Polypedilum vanderplanki]